MEQRGFDSEEYWDESLAADLGLSLTEFIEVFGAQWQPADPPWFISGEPPQLMLSADRGGCELAMPEGVWAEGTHGLIYRPKDSRNLPVLAAEEARLEVARLLKRRRSSFRYCRYCRRLTLPELMDEPGECMACASAYHGVVY